MKKINYITNLSLTDNSGGGSGVNFAAYHQLARYFEVRYTGPIDIPVNRAEHIKSKLVRLMGGKGSYFFFSESRMQNISEEVEARLKDSDAAFDFFHGFTSWIKYKSDRPYFAYADACFATYVRIYNDISAFSPKSLSRIYELEKKWLSNASAIFFRSKWALQETMTAYNIDGKNFHVAGLGGFINIPDADRYAGSKNILFISREFVPKGGYNCFNAFKQLYGKYPGLSMTVIGEEPPPEVLAHPGVHYAGMLRKNVEAEYRLFREIISKAFVLVHPTIKDTNALVLTEAGYFGCVAIATRSFALPELIKHGETGFLIDLPIEAEKITDRLVFLLENEPEYLKMRKAVREFTVSNLVWDKVGDAFFAEINKAL